MSIECCYRDDAGRPYRRITEIISIRQRRGVTHIEALDEHGTPVTGTAREFRVMSR